MSAVITIDALGSTLILNDRSMTSLAEGDYLTLAPVNAATSHVNSSAGGVTITERLDKDVHDLTFRVQKYSDDDVFLQGLINQAGVTLIQGSVKESFTADGQAGVESWTLQNGSVTTQPTQTKNNQDGNAMMEFVMRFRTAKRSL